MTFKFDLLILSNSKMKGKVVCFAIFFACFCESFAIKPQTFLDTLEERDKAYFYRYYLAKGYLESEPQDAVMYPSILFPRDLFIPPELLQKFETTQIEPKDFAVQFFEGFTKKNNITPAETYQVARKRCSCKPDELCLPDGTCFPTGDVGSICCT